MATLETLRFDCADMDWLNFVSANRRGTYRGSRYDMVFGPVANDNTMPVINDYMAGAITAETALTLLMPQRLVDQYAFLSWKGLSVLRFQEYVQYG